MSSLLILSLLQRPASTGTLIPSSRYLADTMARQALGAELVVELGAGTGPVTQALVAACPNTPIVVVEMQARLAHHLRQQFPALDVRQDTAESVLDSLTDAPPRTTLVSSLPFRSLPSGVARDTRASIGGFLLADPARKLVQFTYQPRAPFRPPAGLKWHFVGSVWRNAPPAGVWTLQAA